MIGIERICLIRVFIYKLEFNHLNHFFFKFGDQSTQIRIKLISKLFFLFKNNLILISKSKWFSLNLLYHIRSYEIKWYDKNSDLIIYHFFSIYSGLILGSNLCFAIIYWKYFYFWLFNTNILSWFCAYWLLHFMAFYAFIFMS